MTKSIKSGFGQRYARHKEFITAKEQKKLATARILLAGCGVGSTLAPNLARMGYATRNPGLLIFADLDVVDLSNLNRQVFSESAVGHNKAYSLQEEVLRINSSLKTRVVVEGVTLKNVSKLVAEVDLIIDMIDVGNPAIMLSLHREAQMQKKTLITGFDLGEGTATLVFDYRYPNEMTLERLLGFENILPEDLTDLPAIAVTAIAAQCLIGSVINSFANRSEVVRYYIDYFKSIKNINALKAAVPVEMHGVIDKLIVGELQFIPQMNTASVTLGNVHEAIIRRLVTGIAVKTFPKIIKTDMQSLISPVVIERRQNGTS